MIKITRNLKQNFVSFTDQKYNALTLLRVFPAIIDRLANDNIPMAYQKILQIMYGSLWPMMITESVRQKQISNIQTSHMFYQIPKINPVVGMILRAQRNLEIIKKNHLIGVKLDATSTMSLPNINYNIAMKLVNMINDSDKPVAPDTLIIKLAACLMRENPSKIIANQVQRQHSGRLTLRKQLVSRITTKHPERGSRNKRQVLMFTDNIREDDWTPINSDHNESTLDDYVLEHVEMDEQNLINEVKHVVPNKVNDKISNKMKNDDFSVHDDEYQDMDVSSYGDDELLRRLYGTPSVSDYDGSIYELLQLAAKHNMRKQRKSSYSMKGGSTFRRSSKYRG